METAVTILLNQYNEQREQARQHEVQRANITNIVIALAVGILALVGLGNDPFFSLSAGVFLVGLGIFGGTLAVKHYERYVYHRDVAKAFENRLLDFNTEWQIPSDTYHKLLLEHKRKFGFMCEFRLHYLWVVVDVVVLLLGFVLLLNKLP